MLNSSQLLELLVLTFVCVLEQLVHNKINHTYQPNYNRKQDKISYYMKHPKL